MKRRNKHLSPLLMRASAYLLLVVTVLTVVLGVYQCPIYAIFHINCPGCGMTRAYKALLRLDLPAAFAFHPLFPIPAIWLLYHIFRKRIGWKEKGEALFFAATILPFIVRWIIMMI